MQCTDVQSVGGLYKAGVNVEDQGLAIGENPKDCSDSHCRPCIAQPVPPSYAQLGVEPSSRKPQPIQISVPSTLYGKQVEDPEVTVHPAQEHIRLSGNVVAHSSARGSMESRASVRSEAEPGPAGQGLPCPTADAVAPAITTVGFRPDAVIPTFSSSSIGFRPDTEIPTFSSSSIGFRPDTEIPAFSSSPAGFGPELASPVPDVSASPYALAVSNSVVGDMGIAREGTTGVTGSDSVFGKPHIHTELRESGCGECLTAAWLPEQVAFPRGPGPREPEYWGHEQTVDIGFSSCLPKGSGWLHDAKDCYSQGPETDCLAFSANCATSSGKGTFGPVASSRQERSEFTSVEASSGDLPSFGRLGLIGERTGDSGEKSTPPDMLPKDSNKICPLNQPSEVHEPHEEGSRDSSVLENHDRLISPVSHRVQDNAELGTSVKSVAEIAVSREQDGWRKAERAMSSQDLYPLGRILSGEDQVSSASPQAEIGHALRKNLSNTLPGWIKGQMDKLECTSEVLGPGSSAVSDVLGGTGTVKSSVPPMQGNHDMNEHNRRLLHSCQSTCPLFLQARQVGIPTTLLRPHMSVPAWVERLKECGSSSLVSTELADPYPLAEEFPERVQQQGLSAGVRSRSPPISDTEVEGPSGARAGAPVPTKAGGFSCSPGQHPNHKPLGFSPDLPKVQCPPCDKADFDPNYKSLGFSPDLPQIQGFWGGYPNADQSTKPLGSSPWLSTGSLQTALNVPVFRTPVSQSALSDNQFELSDDIGTTPEYQIFSDDEADSPGNDSLDPCWTLSWTCLRGAKFRSSVKSQFA